MPTRQELIAATHSLEETRKYITADYLGYISVEGMHKAVKAMENEFCNACFTGNYPVEFPPNGENVNSCGAVKEN